VFDWDFAPVPAGPKGWFAYATTNLWCMAKITKYPDEAWRFVKYAVSPPEDLQWAKEWGWVPFRTANLDPWLVLDEKQPPEEHGVASRAKTSVSAPWRARFGDTTTTPELAFPGRWRA